MRRATRAYTRVSKTGKVVQVRASGAAPGRTYKVVPAHSRANGTTVKAHNRKKARRKAPKLRGTTNWNL